MPEVNVLKKRKDFIKVAKQGQKVVSKTIILQAALNFCAKDSTPRLGLTATKKLGKAHIRNRVKRRIRAALRDVLKTCSLTPADYVIIGRYNTADCDFLELKSDLENAIKKINPLLKKGGQRNAKNSDTSSNCPN